MRGTMLPQRPPHQHRLHLSLMIILIVYFKCDAQPTDHEGASWKSANGQSVASPLSMEHRSAVDPDAPIKSLYFYGGAKGKFLLIHPSGRTTITSRDPSYYGLKAEDEDEEDVGMEDGGDTDETEGTNSTEGSTGPGPDESVSVGLPADNTSVAEAKPVGLAIAGPGGVASSRPVGTAVVGPGGLALSKPIATAVAGIPGSEALIGIHGLKKKHASRPLKSAGSVVRNNSTNNVANSTADKGIEQPNGRSYNEVTNDYEYEAADDHANDGVGVIFIPLYLPIPPPNQQ